MRAAITTSVAGTVMPSESRLILTTSGLKLVRGYEIGGGSGVSDQFGRWFASVEILDCANQRFALWNINGRLHVSRVHSFDIPKRQSAVRAQHLQQVAAAKGGGELLQRNRAISVAGSKS